MSMKANILRDAMGNITVQMQGDLDYEHSSPLREELNELSAKNPHAKITVDLGGIDFVGSSGICHFVETVQSINVKKDDYNKMSLSNVSQEFRKIFKLYKIDESELIWDKFDFDNDETEGLQSKFGGRKRTFEN
jgi:anti-sigma B factor antagonist